MATAHDVAAYILGRVSGVSHMKLQKLLYYAQAWSAVWTEKPLFADRIEAWANGPVVPSVFQTLKGCFLVKPNLLPTGNPDALTADERDTVDRVVGFYGPHDPQWLSDLTHMERPWQEARIGVAPGDRCGNEITLASMAEFYGGL